MSQHPQRPLSPHLTIYKPQITSVLSITHRITGVALFVGTIALSLWIIMSVYQCNCLGPVISSTPFLVVLFLWSSALYYHLLNGIRHLFWDAGKGFSIPAVTRSGISVIIGAIILLVITWVPVIQSLKVN